MTEQEHEPKPISDEEREEKRKRASQDKSWPPKSMETKVPRQGGSK